MIQIDCVLLGLCRCDKADVLLPVEMSSVMSEYVV